MRLMVLGAAAERERGIHPVGLSRLKSAHGTADHPVMAGMDPWLANRYAGTGSHEPSPEVDRPTVHETRLSRRRADAVLREVSARVAPRRRRARMSLWLTGTVAAATALITWAVTTAH
ncbi:hypothetical protein [Cellulomonas taurus]|uniref:hypothetical protein n=1 Tax=Cellulomonas taurus TaxID=2729175 RepID=UPI00145EE12C|nr:hypothetical protein [Cellulomonas taurus]